MPLSVSITQNGTDADIFSPGSPIATSLLNAVVTNWFKAGTVVTPTAALLSTDKGYDIFVSGSGLALGIAGQLGTGMVHSISVMSPSGHVLGTMGTALPDGLGLSMEALQDAFCDAGRLDALVADWAITFSASGVVPVGSIPTWPGVTFEGARGADNISGSLGADNLRGGAGDDVIHGRGGEDFLRGDETLYMGWDAPVGHDTMYGGDSRDWVYGGAGNDWLYGGGGNDQIKGDDEWGPAGNDRMSGDAGRDRFYTEGGDDTYFGGDGRDTILVHDQVGVTLHVVDLAAGVMTSNGTDTIWGIEIVEGALEATNRITGGAASEAFVGGFVRDSLKGGDGNDKLWGDFGNDLIWGNGGDDRLAGDGGADTIWGGAGRDAFLFSGGGVDRIEDFAASQDQIWLVSGVAPGLSGTGGIAGSAFKDLSLGGVDATDRLIYDRAKGELFLDADGSGAAARTLLARFDVGTLLTSADFELHAEWGRNDFMV